jgi:hypothetical protein
VAAVQQTSPWQAWLPQSMLHKGPAQREMPTQESVPWQEMEVLVAHALFTPSLHEPLPEQLALHSPPESASSSAQDPVPLQRTMHDPVGQ